MKRYSEAFKARVVQRLVGPLAVSATALAQTVGVSQVTLSWWLSAAGSVDGMTRPVRRQWTDAEELRVVSAAEGAAEGSGLPDERDLSSPSDREARRPRGEHGAGGA